MPNAIRLQVLSDLRRQAYPRLSQSMVARKFDLDPQYGRKAIGAWEKGENIPNPDRRIRFLRYLWDDLRLRKTPERFEEIWQILVEEWKWEPISDEEWRTFFPGVIRCRGLRSVQEAFSPSVLQLKPMLRIEQVTKGAKQSTNPTCAIRYAKIILICGLVESGKTTLALHLAAALIQQQRQVLLIDADPQGASLAWISRRQMEPLFPVVWLPIKNLHKEIPAHAQHYDYILIDAPACVNAIINSALNVADCVLILVQPSSFLANALEELVAQFKAVDVCRATTKGAFVLNHIKNSTVLPHELVGALRRYQLPVLATAISQNSAFATSINIGKTVLESNPESMAMCEIHELLAEVLYLFN